MKYLVVVRHGHYSDLNLTFSGRQKIGRLGTVLAERLNGSSVVLLSSMAIRARETAEILARHFGGIAFEEHECLEFPGIDFTDRDGQEALQLVEERGQTHDVVVLSTHLPFIEGFPEAWGSLRGIRLHGESGNAKGAARLIDLETGVQEYIDPADS